MPSRDQRAPDRRLATVAGRWRTTGHVVGKPPIPVSGADSYEVLPGGHFLCTTLT
jgi:hypothetical protein